MAIRSFLGPHASWAASFQYRDFRFLWGATLLHSLAMGMEQVALGWLVLQLTDSPFMVGVSAAARMAPFFFLGILSGAITDRVDRRIFLRIVTVGGSVIAFLMAAMLLSGIEEVWYVIGLAVATGCMWAFVMTIRNSYTFDIVGPTNALNGLSLNAMGQRIGGVIGSLAAGVIISLAGMGAQYVAIGAVNIAAVIFLLGARDVGQAAPRERESVLTNFVGYFQLLRENRILMTLMLLTGATEIFGFTHQSVLPVYARDVLGVSALGFGIITAVRQGGGAVGLLILAFMGNTKGKGRIMFATATGFGLGQVAFFWSKSLVAFILVLGFINACGSMVDTLYKTLMQLSVTNEQRGRATGSWVLSIGVAPIGHLGVGAIAGSLGAPAALLFNGSVLTAVSIAAALGLPRMRRLQ
ncbi:MAG: MFS transporter [Chloroflexi bacterium]|nr:MFS transporter [Chloroflexota bacterium]